VQTALFKDPVRTAL